MMGSQAMRGGRCELRSQLPARAGGAGRRMARSSGEDTLIREYDPPLNKHSRR